MLLKEAKRRAKKKMTTSDIKRIVLDETDSTNNYAKRISDAQKNDVLIIAKKQTAGRGRTGRSFFSPEGGIYMSLLLHPDSEPLKAEKITIMAAVATARALEEVFAVKPFIKWVNDIYIGGKKVCGILTEGVFDPESGKFRYAVLGVGVNLSFPKGGFPEEIKDVAGAVCDKASDGQKNLFVERFLSGFYDIYQNGSEYMNEYKRRSNILGKNIEYIKDGETKHGLAVDITDGGELAVKDEKEVSYLRSGEVKISVNSINSTER